MGFLSSAEAAVWRGVAVAMMPPPPPDITRWCTENIVFDERSPFPGPFNIDRFPFLRRIHEVLSPEDPSREVTVMGSAQWGKTVSVLLATVAAWHEYGPLDSLVVHPTTSSATEFVRNKWMPLRRQAPSLVRIFGTGRGEQTDTLHNQETLNRDGSLKVVSAGSPDDLAGTTRRLVLMDDVAKFEMTPKGDPEQLAVSRASAFEDAKIVRISTPQIAGTCRITRAFTRSTQEHYHLPCPHCGHRAPLTWENFRRNLDPERLHAACFSCDSCGGLIEHRHKTAIMPHGGWVAHNARGDHPGFHLWRAYVPQRDWASIALEYAQVMGWTGGITASAKSEAELAAGTDEQTEQTFWNDVLGLAFEQATKGPDWEKLRDRANNAEDALPAGIVPACGVLLTAGADCQGDRIEVTIVAWGRNARRWVVEHRVIPHFIGDEDGRAAMDALMKATWRTSLGLPLALDMLAIDEGNFTADVRDWCKRHPWTRVIGVKGASTAQGPVLSPMVSRKEDGGKLKVQRRDFMVNVSQLKADFFAALAKEDPQERGHVGFARGLGDEYFRQITSEVRVLKRAPSGAMVARWELVDTVRRNECLDAMNYAEAAARRKSWAVLTDAQWSALELERGVAPPDHQADLFDAALPVVPLSVQAMPAPPSAEAKPEPAATRRDGGWIKPQTDWIKPQKGWK